MLKQRIIFKKELGLKLLFFFMTFVLNFFLVYTYKGLHDYFLLIVTTFLLCFLTGLFLKLVLPNSKKIIQNLAWGLIYGSATIFVLTLALIIWVAHLYNN